jgi:hypothetical protein
MLRLSLTLLSVGLTLAGCASSTRLGESDLPPISETKLQPCELPEALKSGSHNEVERWAVANGFKYRDCADGKAELIETIKLRQKLLGGQDEAK